MENGRDEIVHFNTDVTSSDLTVYHYGMEKCTPGHSYGPALRDHFLIHYVLSGSGRFILDGITYELKRGQGFLICPDIITYYEASVEDPWTYTWVGFKGIKAKSYLKQANLDRKNPIFSYGGTLIEKCFEDIIKSNDYKYGFDLRLQGLVSFFLSELIESAATSRIQGDSYRERYLRRALQFIETNYSRDITVSELAEFIGLNKNYFSTLFRENMGISPQEYIIKFRINKACELLKNRTLNINEISRSVGYGDPLNFSKIFKQIKGASPKSYREKLMI